MRFSGIEVVLDMILFSNENDDVDEVEEDKIKNEQYCRETAFLYVRCACQGMAQV
jgi:hypothetical protein